MTQNVAFYHGGADMKWRYLLAPESCTDEKTGEVARALDAFEQAWANVTDRAAGRNLVRSAELTLVAWMRECRS